MSNVLPFARKGGTDLEGLYCVYCGNKATTAIALWDYDSGKSAGIKAFCDDHASKEGARK